MEQYVPEAALYNRLVYIYKSVNGLIDCNVHFAYAKDTHSYDTRNKKQYL